MAPPSTLAAASVTAEDAADADAFLDCGVCFLPLMAAPIFQCVVGHVVCSSCRDKVAPPPPAGRRCPVCRAPVSRVGGYCRDLAMKQPVESVRVPCRDAAAYGHAARPAYHDHLRACPHAPCHCPVEACGFAGPTEALLGHFAAGHGWPCTTGARSEASFDVRLRDGVNVVAVDRHDDDQDYTAVTSRYLLLLDVARKPFGRAVSAFCVRPRAAAADDDDYGTSFWRPSEPEAAAWCQVGLTYLRYVRGRGGPVRSYHQRTDLNVACTDLSDGLPDPGDCFHAVVLRSVDRDDEDTVEVTLRVTIE